MGEGIHFIVDDSVTGVENVGTLTHTTTQNTTHHNNHTTWDGDVGDKREWKGTDVGGNQPTSDPASRGQGHRWRTQPRQALEIETDWVASAAPYTTTSTHGHGDVGETRVRRGTSPGPEPLDRRRALRAWFTTAAPAKANMPSNNMQLHLGQSGICGQAEASGQNHQHQAHRHQEGAPWSRDFPPQGEGVDRVRRTHTHPPTPPPPLPLRSPKTVQSAEKGEGKDKRERIIVVAGSLYQKIIV